MVLFHKEEKVDLGPDGEIMEWDTTSSNPQDKKRRLKLMPRYFMIIAQEGNARMIFVLKLAH